jgi:hypothetical protein
MQLIELIFQGTLGCFSPIRLGADGPLSQWELPPHVSSRDLQTLLIALCYPRWLDKQGRERLGDSPKMKLAVTFKVQDRQVRVLRRDTAASLKLQIYEHGAWKDVGRGLGVEKVLQDKLGMPPFSIFSMLHLWRFDEPLPADKPPVDLDALEPKLREVVEKYRIALVAERLDDEVKYVEGRLVDIRKSLGEGAKLEEKYEKAKVRLEELTVRDLADDDLKLLKDRDEHLAELNKKIHRLAVEEEQASEQLHMSLPDRFWKNQIFLGGIVIGVLSLLVSIAMHETHRIIALADIVGFGAAAWIMLRYYNDMEQAAIQGVRLDSIKRRLGQVREEQVMFQERVRHILIHAGVEDEAQLIERIAKSEQLAEIITKMEAQLEKLRANADYRKAMEEREELERRHVEVTARRAETPVSTMSAYQLESDLRSLGLEPVEFVSDLDDDARGVAADRDEDRDAIRRLMFVGKKLGQATINGEISPKTQKMWSKICAHVLGPRFEEMGVNEDGELEIRGLTDAQREMWLKTRASEVQIVAAGLAVALQVNEPDQADILRTVIVPDPDELMSPEHAARFKDVFSSAARRSQVILLQRGRA